MTSDEMRSYLEHIICDIFEIPEGSLVFHDGLDVRLLGDSLKQLELLTSVEAQYGISIDVEAIGYFGDLVRMVERAPHGQSA